MTWALRGHDGRSPEIITGPYGVTPCHCHLVLVVLAYWARDDFGGEVTISSICAGTDLPTDYAEAAIVVLAEHGLVEVRSRMGDTVAYRLPVPS